MFSVLDEMPSCLPRVAVIETISTTCDFTSFKSELFVDVLTDIIVVEFDYYLNL